jgi:hypothetical protein
LAKNSPHGTPNCGQGKQHRAAPLATDADALHKAQHGQDHGAPNTDALVGRDEGDEEGGNPHQHQRRDQRCLAADAVPVVAKDGRPHGAGQEADGIDGKGLERSHQGIGVGKEQLGKDQAGDGAIEKEVIPLDGRTDGAGDHGAAQLNAMFVFGKAANDGLGHA